ncbi:uncharacterized protein LOC126313399 [Schistocerca gregaria]|uniref:uncharacterized protein LOC126313399 n=1 Tax=Schistocerca gregaria TaxID=7010 RepID=UPI00211E73E5|nr:uncharacterized protein LOC126313399 [Schistocerca gregaria]
MAGQFAKPRSKPSEVVDGQTVASYRGDIVSSHELPRNPEPIRLVLAYFHSAATLNYLRTLALENTGELYERFCAPSEGKLACGESSGGEVGDGDLKEILRINREIREQRFDFYMSHEGLLLGYEESLTRRLGTGYYNLGAHFLWIGDRTRNIGHAHVEYFRGLENPIGLKVGPTLDPVELAELVRVLNPKREKGRLTLITRYGVSKVEECLPLHISAVKQTRIPVLWCCDPCHGNTEMTLSGIKTRSFDKIVGELVTCFRVHRESGSRLGGVHLEITGEDVTECTGGCGDARVTNLSVRYETFCDPRLNYAQAISIALKVSEELNRHTEM